MEKSYIDTETERRVISIEQIARQGGMAFWCAGVAVPRASGRAELSARASPQQKAIALQHESQYRGMVQLAMMAGINEARQHWSQTWPLDRAFWLGITIYRTQPVEQKPDLDNYLKLITDAGTKLAWSDDRLLAGYLPGTQKIEHERNGISVVVLPQIGILRPMFGGRLSPLSIEGREMEGARA